MEEMYAAMTENDAILTLIVRRLFHLNGDGFTSEIKFIFETPFSVGRICSLSWRCSPSRSCRECIEKHADKVMQEEINI